jgi:hypothetical protein
MVRCCADAGVPLCAGSISTTHPSFERAKTLLQEGAIGELLSIEAPSPGAQHQDWSYFLDSPRKSLCVRETTASVSSSNVFAGVSTGVSATGFGTTASSWGTMAPRSRDRR